MPSPIERQLTLRRFDGVNLLVDQAYLGPSYLRHAANWIPGETYRLTKEPGNRPYIGGFIAGNDIVLKMIRVYDSLNRYLYVVKGNDTGDQVWVSVNDAAFTRVQLAGGGNADFAEAVSIYDMEVMNDRVFVGNGIDPMLVITIGGTAQPIQEITSFLDGSADPILAADPGSQILTGTYAFAWAIYDHDAKLYLERGQTRTIQVNSGGDVSLIFSLAGMGFATNGGTLSTRYRAHLFVSPVNFPVEFGHNQNPEGAAALGGIVLRVITADGPPMPLQGVARTGRKLRAHRQRMWVGGDQENKSAVWATQIVVPGLEQAIFDSGVFFPINARTPRIHEDVTALGLAATGRDEPDAPIVICGLSSTWLFYGDILDDPAAYFIEVSHTIGCIEQETMVETPIGVFFVGLESVYFVPPGGGPPVDVGWPIRPAIIAIPAAGRAKCRALYHKGFLKLAIVPTGATEATQQWWLDIRQGVGQVPSWWGPSPRAAVAAWCTGNKDPEETDRGYMSYVDLATKVIGDIARLVSLIETIHQLNVFTEFENTLTIVSILRTGDLDDNMPFDRKMIDRVRITAFPGVATQLSVNVSVDGNTSTPWDAMVLPGPVGSQWNVDKWNVAQWGQALVSEGESVSPETRPRGRTVSVQLVHSEAKALSIRDFEVRYLKVEREVRLLPDDPNS